MAGEKVMSGNARFTLDGKTSSAWGFIGEIDDNFQVSSLRVQRSSL